MLICSIWAYSERTDIKMDVIKCDNFDKFDKSDKSDKFDKFDNHDSNPMDIINHKEYHLFLGDPVGWMVHSYCLDFKFSKKEAIIIYGVGAGMDVSWDIEMVKRFGITTKSYIFDPTPISIKTVSPSINEFNNKYEPFPNITFIFEALSTKEGSINFTVPTKSDRTSFREIPSKVNTKNVENHFEAKTNTLKNWMNRFGHTYLDVLKIDIEGSEFPVLEQLLNENYLPFTQLLIEYHDRFWNGAYKEINNRVRNGLKEHGYHIFHHDAGQAEYSYIKIKDIPNCNVQG